MRAIAMRAYERAGRSFDRSGEIGARNRAHPRRGELDAQRQAFDEAADSKHMRHLRGQREAEVRLPCALRKELDRGEIRLCGRLPRPNQASPRTS